MIKNQENQQKSKLQNKKTIDSMNLVQKDKR